MMPLNCAETMALNENAPEDLARQNKQLIKLLLDNEARRTWRRMEPRRLQESFRVLSFSSSHNFSNPRPHVESNHLAAGIQLDTDCDVPFEEIERI
jgi:hypothetical protein